MKNFSRILKVPFLIKQQISNSSTIASRMTAPLNGNVESVPEYTTDINCITTADLMTASLHLGHSKSSWCPNMLPFIYGTRHGLHIINLSETMACLRRARSFIFEVARGGGNVLFVGTRPMLHELVVRTATDNHGFYCINWIGGTITNKERVLRRSVGYDPDKVTQTLQAQSSSSQDDTEEMREIERKRQPPVALPDVLVLLDYPNTKWAVREANITNIPIVAICDTDCDPSLVQYPIPASDDSLKGVELIAGLLGSACKEGYLEWKKDKEASTFFKKRSGGKANKNRQ